MVFRYLHVSIVAGAGPNFLKVAPVYHALAAGKEAARAAGIDLHVSIAHTGRGTRKRDLSHLSGMV